MRTIRRSAWALSAAAALAACPKPPNGPAVAECDVEVPVGAERELTAVVVRLRLVDEQDVAA